MLSSVKSDPFCGVWREAVAISDFGAFHFLPPPPGFPRKRGAPLLQTLQHVHGITSNVVFRHKQNKAGRIIQVHIGSSSDRWLSACICGAHTDMKPFAARGGGAWSCVGNVSANDKHW